MLTVVYCTRQTNPEHKEHLIKSSGLHKNIEVIEIINNGESLTSCYKRALAQAKNNYVVFCHDDLSVETNQWGNKLLKLFNKNPEYGIIGVAGTKYMSETGRWWDDKHKMYGRVAHTHEGKTWLSSYSGDLGQELEEVVVVDGVFFAVDKTKLKKDFNETVEGFHFYDVNFCFENYLEGVKIGVTTVIRINHKSIGATNDEWEKNRVNFSEKFKEQLPVSVKKVLRKNEKLKVLLSSLEFNDDSNKSNIILDLATRLKKNGHDVTICSNLKGKLPLLAKQKDIKVCSILQPPGFLLGDGKWTLNTPNGDTPSQKNILYKIKDVDYNVIHVFDDEIVSHFNRLYSHIGIINTKFGNSLFVNDTKNELVKATLELSNNISDVTKIDINNIVEEYVSVI
jgi:hypothetical protein